MTEIAVLKGESKEKAFKRGQLLIAILGFILVIFGVLYLYLHYRFPEGPLSELNPRGPDANFLVKEALKVLGSNVPSQTGDKISEDKISEDDISTLSNLSVRLSLLEPQFSTTEYSTTLSEIISELENGSASRPYLIERFNLLKEIIEMGLNSYIWNNRADRWIELAMWAFIGNLIFLLNEIKNDMGRNIPRNTEKEKIEESIYPSIKPSSWYAVYFFRGPFIAMVILVALSSVKLELVGISLDLQNEPIEVSTVLAAILGYYSRVASAQLGIIAENLLGNAWEKVYPKDKEIEENKNGTRPDELTEASKGQTQNE